MAARTSFYSGRRQVVSDHFRAATKRLKKYLWMLYCSQTQQGVEMQMNKGNIDRRMRGREQKQTTKKATVGRCWRENVRLEVQRERAQGRLTGGGEMFLCLCSHVGKPGPTLSLQSVSVSRLEAGRPSCDSMWLARASCSLDTHSHSLSEWEGGGLQATERPPAREEVTLCTSELWMSFYSSKEAESAVL